MLSLAELLKAIDKFYALADKVYPFYKRAALKVKSPIYDKVSEDIFDSLSNEDFANKFEEYLEAYENLVNSLSIDPKEFGRILLGGETEDDNFADLLKVFNESYQDLIEDPYLQQGIQDEGWEEGSTPQEVITGIEALAKDAMDRIYALGRAANNWTPTDVRSYLEGRNDDFNDEVRGKSEQAGVGSGQEGAGEGMSAQEQEYRNRKIQKAREAGQSHHRRRGEALTVGQDELARQVNELQDAVSKETNGIKKEELLNRLKDKAIRLKLVNTYQEQQNKQQAKLKSNPEAYAKYVEKNTGRKQSSRDFNAKFFELVKKFNASQSPNDQARIKLDIVRLKKELMQRNNPTLDFDSDEVRFNTKVQEDLNPDKIIADYSKRMGSVTSTWKNQHEVRLLDKAAGKLPGLLQKFTESINSDNQEIKRKLNYLFDDDPAILPFKAKIEAAKKAKDVSGHRKALSELNTFLNTDQYLQVKMKHPAFQAAAQLFAEIKNWVKILKEVDKVKLLDVEPLNENVVGQLKQLIAIGNDIVSKYVQNPTTTQRARDIVTLLESKIQ